MKLSVPLFVLCFALPASARTFTVNSENDAVDAHPGDGVCASAANECTLRAAIMETNALAGADTIEVPQGVYRLTLAGAGEDLAATGDLDIVDDLTIIGVGSDVTLVDGAGLDRVFEVISGNVTLENLTIRNGAALGAGSSVGGGIASRGHLSLERVVVSGNRANTGGGVDSVVTLFVEDSTFEGNETVDAGFGPPIGAGLHTQGSAVLVTSTISGNRTSTSPSASGGGIYAEGGTLTMTNSTIAGNSSGAGGGIYALGADGLLVNVTIAGNGYSGLSYSSFDATKKMRIRNSILANSFAGPNCTITGTFVAEGANVDSGTSCGFTTYSALDARLGPLGDDGGPTLTVPLLPDSTVPEAGKACTDADDKPLVHDQRGAGRPGATCSPGAVELIYGETFSATRIVPIVLDVTGGAHFTSELTLANRGTTRSTLRMSYKAAASLGASGSGTVFQQLGPGEQVVYADAIQYLRTKGLSIPTGSNQGGTLTVVFTGLSTADAGFAGARTTAPSGAGRAGLAYPGPRQEDASNDPLRLFGLRETADDRTNLALVNAGGVGHIRLRVTLHDGAAGQQAASFTLPDVDLGVGEWTQINAPQLLRAAGYANAWATVERVGGVDPFLAYAVFNDNVTNDGSYVFPVSAVRPIAKQLVPALVESGNFESELILTNPGEKSVTATLAYTQSLGGPGLLGSFTETLLPHEQRIIPRALAYLRTKGIPVGTAGSTTFVGTLAVSFDLPGTSTDAEGFAGVRTASPPQGSGKYGLFYPAVSLAETAAQEAWIYGLAQNDSVRSNLALVNAGTSRTTSGSITLRFDVFDAGTGHLAGSGTRTLDAGGWTQVNTVLDLFALKKGYVRVVKTAGDGRLLTYGVVNDGKDAGSGTNDGSFVAMTVVE